MVASARPEPSSVWTAARLDLLDWLQRDAPGLAEAYQGAVTLMSQAPIPGHTRLVAHAVRDIANGLPEVVSGVKFGLLQYVNRLDDLVDTWNAYKLPLSPASGVSGEDLPDANPPSLVSLPTPVFEAFQRLLAEHAEARVRSRDKAERMFDLLLADSAEQSDARSPVVSQWLGLTKWFVSRAHFPRSASSGSVDVAELTRKFELFETTLMALIRAFFSTTEDLDAILEEANS